MSITIKKNVLAYEIILFKQVDLSTVKEIWDSEFFMKLLNNIYGKEKTERAKRKQNEWVMVLDELSHDDTYIQGVFKSTRYGSKSPLLHGLTLEERENPREREEGEQLRTHFLVRKSDGFTLIEIGFQNVVSRSKIEDYFEEIGKSLFEEHDIRFLRVSPLIGLGFFEEIGKLEKIKEAHLEVKVKEDSAVSEAYQILLDETRNLKGNAVRLIVKAQYDRVGLSKRNVSDWARKVKNFQNVRAVRIKGEIGDIDKVIDLEKNAEKYVFPRVKADLDRMVDSEDLFHHMIEQAKQRETIR